MCDKMESFSVQIKNGKFKPFIVTSVYRLPGKPVSYFNELESLFSMLEAQNKESVIIGDINCDFDTPPDNNTRHLSCILNSFGYNQLIKEPTRTTSTTSTIIDHIMTNRPDVVSSSGVKPCGISDHDVLHLIRNFRAPKLRSKYHQKPSVSEIIIRDLTFKSFNMT